jgi:hypothetical protein
MANEEPVGGERARVAGVGVGFRALGERGGGGNGRGSAGGTDAHALDHDVLDRVPGQAADAAVVRSFGLAGGPFGTGDVMPQQDLAPRPVGDIHLHVANADVAEESDLRGQPLGSVAGQIRTEQILVDASGFRAQLEGAAEGVAGVANHLDAAVLAVAALALDDDGVVVGDHRAARDEHVPATGEVHAVVVAAGTRAAGGHVPDRQPDATDVALLLPSTQPPQTVLLPLWRRSGSGFQAFSCAL